ncbi:MAG: urease accessory protein [Thalassobium sp.]|nr:MAG: urease accessory protein [Thalassobium sp.]
MNYPVQPLLSAQADAPYWNAQLQLTTRQTERGTRLVQCEHNGPLYVQKPFYPEGPDCAHLYLLHPPGGMVSGDFLTINVSAGENSHVLVTTPGAGRVYRARADGLLQQQKVQLTVDNNAALEWMPLETILFPSSRAQLETEVHLGENSRYIGWDIVSLGLPANGSRLDDLGQHTTLKQGLRIYYKQQLLLNERLSLHPGNSELLNAAAGFRGMPVHGLLVAGPFTQGFCEQALEKLQELCTDQLAGVSLNGQFLSVRYLGTCSEQARLLLTEAWAIIRPQLMQRPACAPRIWAT